MRQHILITGGAGFIGSHLANELLACGYKVRALDLLVPQVHGPDRNRPAYLSSDVELMVGDVRDPQTIRKALAGIDAVYHFVANVGVGQSMYEIADYTHVNNYGTAVLLEALIERRVRKLVVASSMSIYGEGLYINSRGETIAGPERTLEQLMSGAWEHADAYGEPLKPIPTTEEKPPALPSIYALSKFDQEKMCLVIGRAYGIPAVALRFFNIYGPHQALSNPYTGVLAIFASRLLNGKPPLINEDGQQLRDFVSVYDVARACRLALDSDKANGHALNIGSGCRYTITSLAESVAKAVGKQNIRPEITGKYRAGDVRHCFADIGMARKLLGYEPKVGLKEGLEDLAAWLDGQSAEDRVAESRAELAARGLMV